MERQPGSPVAGKAEEQSGSLLLTYFQGDINSMVDAHFSRALENVTKPKGDVTKSKKPSKSVKSGNTYIFILILYKCSHIIVAYILTSRQTVKCFYLVF